MQLVGVIPCYDAESTIAKVVTALLAQVDCVVAVDDASSDQTLEILKKLEKTTSKLHVLQNASNRGVGGAVIAAYDYVRRNKLGDIVIKVDADGQMDCDAIPRLIAPIVNGKADYVKGNRFDNPRHLKGMPYTRLIGNAGLGLLNKIATGYWSINDPTNGFTAISYPHLEMLELDRLSERYFFESDMLFRLRLQRAVVKDVPLIAIYGDEVSHLRPLVEVPRFLVGNFRNFLKRLVYQYFVREWGPGSIVLPASLGLGLFSVTIGLQTWNQSAVSGEPATAGTVALVLLPAIIFIQLALSFLQIDIESEPK